MLEKRQPEGRWLCAWKEAAIARKHVQVMPFALQLILSLPPQNRVTQGGGEDCTINTRYPDDCNVSDAILRNMPCKIEEELLGVVSCGRSIADQEPTEDLTAWGPTKDPTEDPTRNLTKIRQKPQTLGSDTGSDKNRHMTRHMIRQRSDKDPTKDQTTAQIRQRSDKHPTKTRQRIRQQKSDNDPTVSRQ